MFQKNELGSNVRMIISGTRDAVHVPIVIARFKESKDVKEQLKSMDELKPGQWVKFVDDKYIDFVLSDQENGHGIVDPFLDDVGVWDDIRILLRPGITTPVRHQYEINPAMLKARKKLLDMELEEKKQEDPECADCWQIKNGDIVRM